VQKTRLFSGSAGAAVLPCAKTAWMRISGGCHATASHGFVLTAENQTVSETSKGFPQKNKLPVFFSMVSGYALLTRNTAGLLSS